MKFEKITLKNFRQFRGVQVIDFSCDDPNRNVSVVFGENGRGKTGIFRAIMFGLYGDWFLSQDQLIDKNELNLVNLVELRKSSSDKPVECYVEIEFSHNDMKYALKRDKLAMLDKGKAYEEDGAVCLTRFDSSGNAKIIPQKEIPEIVDSILDKRVREYFLFDGEKIEKLTRATPEQRKEIGKGIRNLLNVDSLEKAKKALSILEKRLSKDVISSVSGEIAKLINQINLLKEEQERNDSEIKNIQDEISHAEAEKLKIDKELESIKGILGLLRERKDLESLIEREEVELSNLLSQIKSKVGVTSLLLVKSLLNDVFEQIDQKKKKGEIPSEIRKDLIDKLIEAGTCICGRPLVPGSECFDQIVFFKNKANDLEVESSILELWRHLSTVNSKIPDVDSEALFLLQKFGTRKNELEKVRKNLEKIAGQIGDSERPDAHNLEGIRQTIQAKMAKLDLKLEAKRNENLSIKTQIEALGQQKKEKQRLEGVQNEKVRRADAVSACREAMDEIYNDFTMEIKNVIGKSATDFFKELIDDEGRSNFSGIVVNPDYSLQILDQWQRPFLANISAGQRQIMSISFISALAKAASGDDLWEMPLFMDTPFGRLSYSHRRNLIEKLPGYASQWILLATDTEFRKPEARLLYKANKMNRTYHLKTIGPGETEIVELSEQEMFSLLQDYDGE